MLQSEDRARRLLLISNSTLYGSGYLDHVASAIDEFLGESGDCLFFPHALFDRDGYAARARDRFAAMGRTLTSIHALDDPAGAIARAESLFIGGGNTFRLLDSLHRLGLIEPIRARVAQGVPFIGSSAGSIVACPTIRTTKDMPIVEPPTLGALRLVSFQISPHFLDPDPNSTHMGETQEERIGQFLEENDLPVVGLREGAYLRVASGRVRLEGRSGARLFRRGQPPVEALPGTELTHA